MKKNSFKIISVSRLTERKNISELLNQVYLSKLKNIEILIVGDGPEKKKLIELSKKFKINCKFLGFLYHDKIPQLLSVSNLYCLLSKFDASPKSINEAMNFKLPIIINQTIGTADDLIKNNFNGIVLKKNSDFSKKLKKIVKDKKKLNYMSENSYHMLDKFFSHKICVNNVLKYSK